MFSFAYTMDSIKHRRLMALAWLATAALWLVGSSAWAASGGPDAFGYTYIDSDEPELTYAFEDINGTGNAMTLGDDQAAHGGGTFLFSFLDGGGPNKPFAFYGEEFVEIYVSSNGFFTFVSTGSTDRTPDQIPNPNNPNRLIAGWWEDLNPANGGTLWWDIRGTYPYRRFIFQWDDVPHDLTFFEWLFGKSPANSTFQVVIYETTNIIDVVCPDANSAGDNHAVGIENADASVGLSYFWGTGSLADDLSIRFDPNPNVVSIARADPSPAQAGTVDYTVTFDRDVQGVDASDFALDVTGTLAGHSISNITNTGPVYTVTVNTGSGSGDLTLRLVDDDSIVVGAPVATGYLGTFGAGNGDFTGETYSIDGDAPVVTAVNVVDGLNVDVTFSEPLTVGGDTAGNYALSGSGRGTLAATPNTVGLQAGNTYRLTWDPGVEMFNGGDITITVSNVEDGAGNTIGSPASGTDVGGGIGILPTVTDVDVVDGFNIDVTFSEPIAGGATLAANYTLGGAGQGTLAATPDSVVLQGGTTYRLTWSTGEMLGGGTVTVTAQNMNDAAGNPLGSPNFGTDVAGGVGIAPTVTSVSVVNTREVDIVFSEPMAGGVLNFANYTISGAGRGSLAVSPDTVADLGGDTYRLSWTVGEMLLGGDVTITVAAVTDAAGNPIGTPDNATDVGGGVGVRPVVSSIAAIDNKTIDVTFSELLNASAIVAGNYALSGTGQGTLAGTPDGVVDQGGGVYRLSWSVGEMVTGTVTITVTGVADIAGNAIGSPNSASAAVGGGVIDEPTVTAVSVVDGMHVDVIFSEMLGSGALTAGNYTLSDSGQGSLAATPDTVAWVSGSTYRLMWSAGEMRDGGDITITVENVSDPAGNPIGSPNSATDAGGAIGVAPTVVSAQVTGPGVVRVNFSESMTPADAADPSNYTVSGTGRGTLAAQPDGVTDLGGGVFELTWLAGEMLSGGDVTITAADGQDLAGNPLGVPDSATAVGGGQGVAPTMSSVNVTGGRSVQVAFSEGMGPGTLTAANYTVSGSGMGTLAAQPTSVTLVAGSTYQLDWASGEMKIGGSIRITAAGVGDLAGNPIGVPDSATDLGGAIGVAPTVSGVNVVDGRRVDVTFSEAMASGITAVANYTLSGSGRGSLAAKPTTVTLQSGTTWRLAWATGEMVLGGDITVTVAGPTDLAGNPMGSPDSGTDALAGVAVPPTVAQVNVTSSNTVEVVFSEAMGSSSTLPAAYALSGSGRGTLAADPTTVTQLAAERFELAWAAGEMLIGGDITITAASVRDLAGNDMGSPDFGTDAGAGLGRAPRVLAIDRYVPADAVTSAVQVTFRVSFSEAVQNVLSDNFSVITPGGGMAGSFISAINGAGATREVIIDTAPGAGDLGLDLDEIGTLTDLAGNALATSFTLGQLYSVDREPPTVVAIRRTSPTVALTNAEQVRFEVLFSETVSGASLANFAVDGTDQQASATLVAIEGAGTTRVVTVATRPGVGILSLDLVAAAPIRDGLGNPLAGPFGSGQSFEIDRRGPTVVGVAPGRGEVVAALNSVQVSFSEEVAGLSAEHLVVQFSPATILTDNGGGVYTFGGFPSPSGTTVTVQLLASFTDLLGNPFAGDNWVHIINDERPTAAMGSLQGLVNGGATNTTPTLTVTFSEPVDGLTSAGLEVTSGTVALFDTVTPGLVYSVVVAPDEETTVSVRVRPNVSTSLAPPFNANEGTAWFRFLYDITPPTSDVVTSATKVTGDIPGRIVHGDGTGSGVEAVRLFVRKEGDVWRDLGEVVAADLAFTPDMGSGAYFFQTVATDKAGNSQAAPAGAVGIGDAMAVYNETPNGPVPRLLDKRANYLFPMEDAGLDITFNLQDDAVTSGWVTVRRVESPRLPKALDPDDLIDEALEIENVGLSGFSGVLIWEYQLSNGLLPTDIETAYRFEGDTFVSATNTLFAVPGRIDILGVDGFSTWYAGKLLKTAVGEWELYE